MSRLPNNASRTDKCTLIFLSLFIFIVPGPTLAQKVGINTNTPQAGLHVVTNDGLLLDGEFGQGAIPATGYGLRLMWTPKTGSFRTGILTDGDGGIYEDWWNLSNTGDYSFSAGTNLKASGFASVAFGEKNQATGEHAFVLGQANIASGKYSFAEGLGNTAASGSEFVIGNYATLYTPAEATGFNEADRVFVIGNGIGNGNRHNALTILKNGNVGIGVDTPASTLHLLGTHLIDGGSIAYINTGESIFIGQHAGEDDDHSTNRNVFIGDMAGKENSAGENNIAIGAGASQHNNANDNISIGRSALNSNTSGSTNIAIGTYSLDINTVGISNTAIGYESLGSLTTASGNTGVGYKVLFSTNGHSNTALGYEAGLFAGGQGNVFLGYSAGKNETGNHKLYISNNETSSPLIYGEFDQKKVVINDTMQSGFLRITQGAAVGHILQSDVSGKGVWTAPSEIFSDDWNANGNDIYNTNSANIGIGTNSPMSKLHVAGDVLLDGGRIGISNTGGSVLIGEGAGESDALDDNANVFIGKDAGFSNTQGLRNIALGEEVLYSNMTGDQNIALGHNALYTNNTGSGNIALGDFSLYNQTDGGSNIGIGAHALESNISGQFNMAFGFFTGFSITGDENTMIGHEAGWNTTGSGNLFLGYRAGYAETGSNKLYIDNSDTSEPLLFGDFDSNHLTVNDSLSSRTLRVNGGRVSFINTGQSVFIGKDAGINDDLSDNNSVFIGYEAGKANSSGTDNIALGTRALDEASSANYNVAIGENVMGATGMTGNLNVGIGHFSLENLTSGHDNIAVGQNALGQATDASNNIVLGIAAADALTTGARNIVLGREAMGESATGEDNVIIGHQAGQSLTGNDNTMIGYEAGYFTQGSGNVFLGNLAGRSETGSNKLYIDNSDTGTPLIYGDFSSHKVTINDSLQMKYFRLTNGASSGKVIQSDASGNGTWVAPNLLFEDTLAVNLFIGQGVGSSITTATDNTIIGSYAGAALQSGYENTGYGKWSLLSNVDGVSNTAIGHNTLSFNTSGDNNTALGWSALAGVSGSSNVGIGNAAGGENTSGSQNVYLGTESGMNNNGSGNVFIGHNAGKNVTGSNKLNIDNTDTNAPLIQGDFTMNEVTINDSLTVNKELGVATSTPNSTFEVNGSVATKFKTPLVAGAVNPDDTGMVWRYNSGTGTITLPSAATCTNRIYVIINQTGATRTISTYRNLTQTNTTTINASVALWVMSDGAEWWQIK